MATEGRSWRAHEFGDPQDVLKLENVTWEPPTPDRLLVRVAACGVGLPDLLMVQGRYPLTRTPPIQPGQEVVGVVVEAGADAHFRVGDRVMGLTPFPEGTVDSATMPTFVRPRHCSRRRRCPTPRLRDS